MTAIENTDITIEWLTTILQEQEGVKAQLKSWKITKCCSGGGFLSNIVAIELEWDAPNTQLPTLIVVKVKSTNSLLQNNLKDLL
jgi:hypothetical protein